MWDDEGVQSCREIPLGHFMVDVAHSDNAVEGPICEKKPQRSGFGEPVAVANRPLLVQAEDNERSDVGGREV